MFNPGLKIGEIIDNDRLCNIFKCGPQGGMRKSNSTQTLVLVANYVKGIYHDRWIGGVLHFTGMGQFGNQSINERQNKTLFYADSTGVDVFLFEVLEEREYTYCGRVKRVGKEYQEKQVDANGKERNVWIFPIKPVPDNQVKKPEQYVFKDWDDYLARGKNVDKEYEKFRKQNKKKNLLTNQQPLQKAFPTPHVDAEAVLAQYTWLKGKCLKHKKYGTGEVKEITCSQRGSILMTVLFEQETTGKKEYKLEYKTCTQNNLIEFLP